MIASVDTTGYRARQLTIEHYDKVKLSMGYMLCKKYGKHMADKEALVNRSISYLFEAAMRYNEDDVCSFHIDDHVDGLVLPSCSLPPIVALSEFGSPPCDQTFFCVPGSSMLGLCYQD